MRFRWSLRVASAAIVTGVVLATPVTVQAEGGQAVTIHDYQYHPGAMDVVAGTSVTWTNEDTAKHDIATTSGPVVIRSPELGEGESFTFTFTSPGTYQYLCTIHPDMVASVAVAPAPATTTTVAASDTAPSGASIDAGATGAETAAPAVPVASVEADLGSAARPYLLLLAAVAAVVAGSLLLMGVGRRAHGS